MTDVAQPVRGISARTPSAPRPNLARLTTPFAVLAALAVLMWLLGSDYYLYIADLSLLAAVAAIGLNLLTGTAGQLSIGTAALLAIGAFSAVPCAAHIGFLPSVLAGGVAAAGAGLVIGFPSLRLRGMYLVFSTLALQYIVSFAFQELETKTNHIAGYTLPYVGVGGISIDTDRRWFVFLTIVVLLTCLVATGLVRGRPGRAWRSIRDHDVAASVIGVNVSGGKLSAFMISSFIIGCSGALSAFFLQNVSYESYTLDVAVSFVAMIIIGGLGSVWGSVAGAVVVTALPYVIRSVATNLLGSDSSLVRTHLAAVNVSIYAAIVIAFLLFMPAGLSGLVAFARRIPMPPISLPAIGLNRRGRRD